MIKQDEILKPDGLHYRAEILYEICARRVGDVRVLGPSALVEYREDVSKDLKRWTDLTLQPKA